MRIIVTGASGFLGKELVKQLCERDMDFLAATSRPSLLVEQTGISASSVIEAKQLLCEEVYEERDVIMNCAFPRTNDGAAMAEGLNYLAQLICCAMRSKAAGFVNISSQSVYSQHRIKPAIETDVLCLESSYAVAKRGIELLLEAQAGCVPCTNIRLASLIGPNFDQRVPNRMAKIALETGQIQVADNGSQFGFMDVRDAAGALISMLEHPIRKWRHVYNLSSEKSWILPELAEMVKNVIESYLDRAIDIQVVASRMQELPLNTLMDATAFRRDFGWKPAYGKKESIESIVLSVL